MTNFISSSVLDIIFSIPFKLLLPSKTIFLCFFLFYLIPFKSFLAIPLLIENTKLRLALVILTGAPIIVTDEAIETPPLVVDKTCKVLPK